MLPCVNLQNRQPAARKPFATLQHKFFKSASSLSTQAHNCIPVGAPGITDVKELVTIFQGFTKGVASEIGQ
jgi:hypothetical protein